MIDLNVVRNLYAQSMLDDGGRFSSDKALLAVSKYIYNTAYQEGFSDGAEKARSHWEATGEFGDLPVELLERDPVLGVDGYLVGWIPDDVAPLPVGAPEGAAQEPVPEGPLSVGCPVCGAVPGERCRGSKPGLWAPPGLYHWTRFDIAAFYRRKAAAARA